MNNKYKMYKKNCGCHPDINCGCHQPNIAGCRTKVDLLCTEYTGPTLETLEVGKGENANNIFKIINDILANLPQPEDQQVLIESVGNAVPVYKGLNPVSFIHEIKSIRGIDGIIVRDRESNDCDNGGNEIDVLIDTNWLTNFLNQWILTVNLCPLIESCNPQTTHNPATTNIIKSLDNRATYTFTNSDFLTHYTDSQGHPLKSVTLTGDTTGYTYNNSVYASGTEILISDITTGKLKYVSNNVDAQYTKTTTYSAKDSLDNVSNNSSIIITVAEKVFLVFSTPTVNLIRSVSNSKTANIGFTNGTGQVISNGTVLVNQGTVGQPGYLKITTTSTVTAGSSGNIPISVSSIPSGTQANQTVNYTLDGSNGSINLTYNSNPVTSDIVINLPHLGSHTFTTAEFVAHYTDFDSDNLVEIKAESPVNNYKYNGAPYVAGTWIPVNNVNQLTYTANNQITAYSQTTPWYAKDSQGNIST